jgi:predicted enzyme related to lactoylglutathione lyase
MNQVQVEQKSYQMPPQDGFTVAYFLTVADIERSARFYETVFGSHSEQRSAGVHPDREYVAHCQRRGRSDTRQTIGNAQRPRRSRFSQQLYEYPRCRYSSVL